jgi:hypothetical protein
MGYQILRQPGDADPPLYALFGSSSDTIVMWDATEADVHEFFRELAEEDVRRSTQRCLDAVKAGEPRKAYYQFAMTWDQALATDQEHGGEAWQAFTAAYPRPSSNAAG